MLRARYPQPSTAPTVNGALPRREFFHRQIIPFASLVHAQQLAGDGSDHFGLAANDPSAANPMARIRQRTQYSEPEWVVRWGCRSKGRTICRDAAYCAIGYANSARQ